MRPSVHMRNAHFIATQSDAQGALREAHHDSDTSTMSVGSNIRRLREARGWKILELASRVDSDVGNISRLERGKQGYSDEMLQRIAKALGCGMADLFAAADGAGNVASIPIGTRRIPLVDYVQAGVWTEVADPYAVGDAAEWLLTDLDLSANAFALRIKGDSMLPEFREGDTVIIDPTIAPSPGDFVVARNGEHEATFKKYRPRGINEHGDQVFELVPLNEDYPSMRSDITPIVIIGTMIEHRRYRRK